MRSRLKGVEHHLDQLATHAATQRQEVAQAAADAWEEREARWRAAVAEEGAQGAEGARAADGV